MIEAQAALEPVMGDYMGPCYARTDGVKFDPGDWVEIDKGVGKFMGVWVADGGLIMTRLCYYRSFANPAERDTFWGSVGKLDEEAKPCFLDQAFKVEGPLKPNGRRPKRFDPQ
jgi:hypothetical protein